VAPARTTPALGQTLTAPKPLAPLNVPPPRDTHDPFAPANIAPPPQLTFPSSDQPPAQQVPAQVVHERRGPNWAAIVGIGLIVLGLLGGVGAVVQNIVGDRVEQMIDEEAIEADLERGFSAIAGEAMLAAEEYDSAIEIFEELIAADLANPEVYTLLGDAYRLRGDRIGDDDNAEEDYKRAVAAYEAALNSERSVAALGGMGWAYEALGEHEAALDTFAEALALDPDDAGLHNGSAYSYLNLQSYAEAEAAFRQAIELDPAYDNAYYGLGRTLEEQGRAADARAAYEEALRINPDNGAAENARERLED
ncbi:tetratricopeptide repeat protein, partial [Candidatus Gracilibacteria bacterium]|nr:tetratricopeptide repeat protein [Candidatus Gracilibacteria bacterium]